MKIAAFCGSLRAGSFNRSLLRVAVEEAPTALSVEEMAWGDVPPFNSDQMKNVFPASVLHLCESIRAADGVLIVCPEYNFSVPGMFKNMLDWVSRHEAQPFVNKPVAIMSAATGPLGGARMQYDLRRIMLFLNASVLVKPEVFVGMAAAKFDAQGACTDEPTRGFVRAQMAAFEDWIRRNRASLAPRS